MIKIKFAKPDYKLKKDYYEGLVKYAFSSEALKTQSKKDQEVYDYLAPMAIKLAKTYGQYARVLYRLKNKELIFLFMDDRADKEGFALHVKYVERKAIIRGKKVVVPCFMAKQDYWVNVDKAKDFKSLSKRDDL